MHAHHDADRRQDDRSAAELLRRAAVRLAGLCLCWSVLTQGARESWSVGVPVVLLATLTSLWLSAGSRWRCRLTAVPGFVLRFTYYSLRGGIDVASRACRPSLPIVPSLLDYSLRLSDETAVVFFANIISLMPGTLSADLHRGTIRVHVLDITQPVLKQLQDLETAVAQLFGCPLGPAHAEAFPR